jgi:hypothetical protein
MAITLSQPLSTSQQKLRGRKIVDMNDDQLADWIAACHSMEAWPVPQNAKNLTTAASDSRASAGGSCWTPNTSFERTREG